MHSHSGHCVPHTLVTVCAAALSTPRRMRRHLEGRRHCEAVARAHLASAPPDETPDAASASAALEACSTAVLARCAVEPPDVALAALMGAMGLD